MSVIVNIDHETGDLSQYTNSVTGGGDLSAAAGAALAATDYGLKVVVNDDTPIYAEYELTEASTTGVLRVRIYLHIESIIQDKFGLWCLDCLNSSGDTFLRLSIARYDTNFDVVVFSGGVEGLGSWKGGYLGENLYIEIYHTRSSELGTDGVIQLYLGDNIVTNQSDNNYLLFADFKKLHVGYLGDSRPDITPTAEYYIDEIIVNDDGSEIGADVIPSPVTPTPVTPSTFLPKWKYDISYHDRSFDVLEYNRTSRIEKDATYKLEDTEG